MNLAMEKQGQNEANPAIVSTTPAIANKTMHVVGIYEGK
jgi:hypothetical protein